MNCGMKFSAALLLTASCFSTFAATTPEEAKQLGSTLTDFGAVQAASKDGAIPAYTGGLQSPPTSYDPAKPGVLPDPFADEKPLFSIDAKNVAQYGDKLAAGVKAMLAKYPDYRLDVYPSHRTMVYPKYVLDNSVKNATQCNAVGESLKGCAAGLPFPIPKTGDEVMWDKFLAYQGVSSTFKIGSYVVDASGNLTLMGWDHASQEAPFYDPSNNGSNDDMVMMRFRYDTVKPPRAAGERLLLSYPVDLAKDAAIYQYLPGQRRVKLSPDLAYDTPNPQSAGSSGMDDVRGFWGRMDRFDFKMVGKKEMYIPYNSYKLFAPECADDKLMTKGHLNPACVRWELHRVWVVEATLKPGRRHIYSKRIMYIDEDSYAGGVYEGYDAAGKLYRVTEQLPFLSYNDKTLGMFGQSFATYDLQTGIYGAFNLPSHDQGGQGPIAGELPSREWTADALAGSGIR